MKIKILLATVFVFVLNGCFGILGPDRQGWKYTQKKEFVQILKTDKYMSICDDKALAAKAISSRNSRIMTKMLTEYANNLANSCIDRISFETSQNTKKLNKIETYFSMPKIKIDSSMIREKLRTGMSVNDILKPYVPTVPQFKLLISNYKAYKKDIKSSTTILYKLRLNIERTKLLPKDLGVNYVLMNIPEMKVRVFENGKKNIEFRTIVGKTNMQTPVFASNLKYIMVNPQWNVPDSIARKSYIPILKRNPTWLASKGMELHKSYDLKSPKVNPRSVDWSKYPKSGKGYIPYKIIQKPSNHNSLGRVKFMFPNRFSVYMHDTQSKNLFNSGVRAYSHGCIRLQKPTLLLDHITKNYTRETVEVVHKRYNSRKSYTLSLNKDLPVYTSYFTIYVDTDGKLRKFNDIYGFDKTQKLIF